MWQLTDLLHFYGEFPLAVFEQGIVPDGTLQPAQRRLQGA
jgi:hypothetical protein